MNHEELSGKLVVRNAEEVDVPESDANFFETVHELPVPESLRGPGLAFSPFIAQFEFMEDLPSYMAAVSLFEESRDQWWDVLDRAYEFRSNGDDKNFRIAVAELDGDIGASAKASIVEDALFKARWGFFGPAIEITGLSSRLRAIDAEIQSLEIDHASELQPVISKLGTDYLEQIQIRILDLDRRFVALFADLRGVIATYYYKDQTEQGLDKVRLQGANFGALKTFYIDCYETMGQAMELLVGLANVAIRGNGESFRTGVKPLVSTLGQFEKLGNAKKLEYLDPGSFSRNLASSAMDPKLRNAIGHNDITLDLDSQELVYLENGKERRLRYVDFARNTYRLYAAIHDLYALVVRLRWVTVARLGIP